MTAFKYNRLNKDDAAVLLVDHQAGLLSLVRDIEPDAFKNNVLALADLAKFFNLPTILTTSFEQGPNGPLVPELKALFPDAPYIARPGQINAWDNADFVQAVKATGKRQLILAGVVTEVCVAFPALAWLAFGVALLGSAIGCALNFGMGQAAPAAIRRTVSFSPMRATKPTSTDARTNSIASCGNHQFSSNQ